MGAAAERWASELAAWAIPDDILAQAGADPWWLTPALFPPSDPSVEPADTASRRRALEALGAHGRVLDVGCGSGAASLALVPPATYVIGVDVEEPMLDAFRTAAGAHGLGCETHHGRWPDVAAGGRVPVADVAVCHHAFYNVADLGPFGVALGEHARRRVVVELTASHPVTNTNPLWKHFWDLDRPEGPVAGDAVAVLRETGIEPHVEREVRAARRAVPHAHRVAFMTRRLCLPPDRQPEVEEAMARWPEPPEQEIVTLWWDPPPRP